MKKLFLVEGSTPDHILAVKAEVEYDKGGESLYGAHWPRGYYLRVYPVDRKRSVLPARDGQPELAYWSETFVVGQPSVRSILKEVTRKSGKAEAEAVSIADSIVVNCVRSVAAKMGWSLTGEVSVVG